MAVSEQVSLRDMNIKLLINGILKFWDYTVGKVSKKAVSDPTWALGIAVSWYEALHMNAMLDKEKKLRYKTYCSYLFPLVVYFTRSDLHT